MIRATVDRRALLRFAALALAPAATACSSLIPGPGTPPQLYVLVRKTTFPPDLPNVKVTTRLGPPVLGRGYLEAIDDAEIVRVQALQAARTDAIHGQINRVTFASVPNPDTSFSHYQQGQPGIIGRFGVKARVPVLDDFAADAYRTNADALVHRAANEHDEGAKRDQST